MKLEELKKLEREATAAEQLIVYRNMLPKLIKVAEAAKAFMVSYKDAFGEDWELDCDPDVLAKALTALDAEDEK